MQRGHDQYFAPSKPSLPWWCGNELKVERDVPGNDVCLAANCLRGPRPARASGRTSGEVEERILRYRVIKQHVRVRDSAGRGERSVVRSAIGPQDQLHLARAKMYKAHTRDCAALLPVRIPQQKGIQLGTVLRVDEVVEHVPTHVAPRTGSEELLRTLPQCSHRGVLHTVPRVHRQLDAKELAAAEQARAQVSSGHRGNSPPRLVPGRPSQLGRGLFTTLLYLPEDVNRVGERLHQRLGCRAVRCFRATQDAVQARHQLRRLLRDI